MIRVVVVEDEPEALRHLAELLSELPGVAVVVGYWGSRLAEHGVTRVHRNALVRLAAVRELTTDDELVLGSGRIAISRRRMEESRRALGLG